MAPIKALRVCHARAVQSVGVGVRYAGFAMASLRLRLHMCCGNAWGIGSPLSRGSDIVDEHTRRKRSAFPTRDSSNGHARSDRCSEERLDDSIAYVGTLRKALLLRSSRRKGFGRRNRDQLFVAFHCFIRCLFTSIRGNLGLGRGGAAPSAPATRPPSAERRLATMAGGRPDDHRLSLGESKNTVRGYCLDIPRFEESLNN